MRPCEYFARQWLMRAHTRPTCRRHPTRTSSKADRLGEEIDLLPNENHWGLFWVVQLP
jgi:hypothetical protein